MWWLTKSEIANKYPPLTLCLCVPVPIEKIMKQLCNLAVLTGIDYV